MLKTKDELNVADRYAKEIELLREKLDKLISIRNSFCDSEIVSLSQQLDRLVLEQMKERLLNGAI